MFHQAQATVVEQPRYEKAHVGDMRQDMLHLEFHKHRGQAFGLGMAFVLEEM